MRGRGGVSTLRKAPLALDLYFSTFSLFLVLRYVFLSQAALVWRCFLFVVLSTPFFCIFYRFLEAQRPKVDVPGGLGVL